MKFQGELIDLQPYSREHFAKDVLYHAWKYIDIAGDWQKLFWDWDSEKSRGDLPEFCGYIHNESDPKVLWFATDITTGKYVGLIMFNKISKIGAWGAIWVVPEFRRGGYAREFVKLVAANSFEQFKWEKIWAVTPWPIARNLLRKCGFKLLGEAPGYTPLTKTVKISMLSLENPNV